MRVNRWFNIEALYPDGTWRSVGSENFRALDVTPEQAIESWRLAIAKHSKSGRPPESWLKFRATEYYSQDNTHAL